MLRNLVPDAVLRLAANTFRVRRKMLYAADVKELRECSPKVAALYRFGGLSDLDRFSESFYGVSPEQDQYSQDRLNAGDWLVIAERASEVLYSGWVMFGKIDLGVGDFYEVGANTVASYRLFTRQDQRGNRLCAAYFSFLKTELRKRGISRVVSWVEVRNESSRKVHESGGFRPLGVVWHLRLLGKSLFWMPEKVRSQLVNGGSADRVVREAKCV